MQFQNEWHRFYDKCTKNFRMPWKPDLSPVQRKSRMSFYTATMNAGALPTQKITMDVVSSNAKTAELEQEFENLLSGGDFSPKEQKASIISGINSVMQSETFKVKKLTAEKTAKMKA